MAEPMFSDMVAIINCDNATTFEGTMIEYAAKLLCTEHKPFVCGRES